MEVLSHSPYFFDFLVVHISCTFEKKRKFMLQDLQRLIPHLQDPHHNKVFVHIDHGSLHGLLVVELGTPGLLATELHHLSPVVTSLLGSVQAVLQVGALWVPFKHTGLKVSPQEGWIRKRLIGECKLPLHNISASSTVIEIRYDPLNLRIHLNINIVQEYVVTHWVSDNVDPYW